MTTTFLIIGFLIGAPFWALLGALALYFVLDALVRG